VVFVPDTKAGDEVRVKIVSVRRRFAFAEKV
jgi:predicted RNA-binding protein with TRAM domain